ncbi:MAG: hypothetical protein R2795_09375 [Saprospiraceae bacterium]
MTATFTPDAGECANPTTITVVVTPAATPTFTNPGSLVFYGQLGNASDLVE